MKLFLASGNAHKLREFRELFAALSAHAPHAPNVLSAHTSSAEPAARVPHAPHAPYFQIESAAALGGMPSVVEDTGSFEGNARKKARALAARLPELPAPARAAAAAPASARPFGAEAWALADDSGLCVDALGGAPGVESAYYAGPAADSAANVAKLVEAMRGIPPAQRGAHFVCVLVLASRSGREYVFRGECHGQLAHTPRGAGGFGYDSLFIPRGFEHTFGELPRAIKLAHSHRTAAACLLTSR